MESRKRIFGRTSQTGSFDSMFTNTGRVYGHSARRMVINENPTRRVDGHIHYVTTVKDHASSKACIPHNNQNKSFNRCVYVRCHYLITVEDFVRLFPIEFCRPL
jgi:hypothetical protein